MRSFQLIFLIVFLVLFLLTTLGTFNNLKSIIHKKSLKIYNTIFLLFHFLVIIVFIFLYVYPNQPRNANNYSVYLIFNFILFSLFIFNLPNAFAYTLHIIFTRKKAPVIPYTGFIIGFGIVLSMAFGTVVGTRQLNTNYHDLYFNDLPEAFNEYEIFLFTDTHLGGMLSPGPLFREAEKVVNQVNPDLVLFAGDLVNNFAYETDGFKDYFQRITENRHSFSILGNHDYGDYSNWDSNTEKEANFKSLNDAHQELGFTLLRNENVVIKRGTDSIYLAGVENWGHPPFPQYARLDSALKNVTSDNFTILMTHDPAHWESQVENKKNIHLSVSGHTHGMQWGIKVAGIPFSLAYFSRKYWGGLYRSGNSVLYVNTGFGTVGVPWRLDMPAEITVFTLKRGEIN